MLKNKNILVEVSREDINLLYTNSDAFWLDITTIVEYAFSICNNLTHIKIPDTVTEIRTGAFCKCPSLISVQLPKDLKTIPDSCFRDSPNLESVI